VRRCNCCLVDAGLRGVPDGFGILAHLEGAKADWPPDALGMVEGRLHAPTWTC
jgi:hypothetical protein